jgi:hypothetical protein
MQELLSARISRSSQSSEVFDRLNGIQAKHISTPCHARFKPKMHSEHNGREGSFYFVSPTPFQTSKLKSQI